MPETSDARADLATCTAMLKEGSKSFAAASMLLPRRVREPATALYAFCRIADDAIDLSPDSILALSGLNERLDRVYAGNPLPQAVDRAFADVVARFAIPREIPQALLEGFAWDAGGKTYDSLADVEAYGVRVAGTVGIMMAMVMGARSAESLARACDLGIAMQLTNIARDIGEDARAGRLYLPRQWLREAGIEPEAFLANPQFGPQLGSVVERLLQAANRYYRLGCAGIADLPADCRPAIHAARLIYAEIGRKVAANGFDSVSRRARVSGRRKIALLLRAVAAGIQRSPVEMQPAVACAQPLIAAVLELHRHKPEAAAGSLDRRIARAIEILASDRPRRQVPRRLGRLAAAE